MKSFLILLVISFAYLFGGIFTQIPESPRPGGIVKQPESFFERVMPTLVALERNLDDRMNSTNVHRVGKILDVSSQIVAGIRYYINFEFGQTTCLKNATTAIEQCNEFIKQHKCYLDVWLQPWLDQTELQEFKCEA